ncbi:MAG: hypothetical protein U5Q44_15665 [Dehalococcoidia bacterium]|nr:hypothetical protein [Dehalococcoidia bacterium]
MARTSARHRELLARATRSMSAAELQATIIELLDAAGLDQDTRVEVLGGALVSEAVRPYWEAGLSAEEAHDALARNDEELAEAVETLGPMLLGRAQARDDASRAIGSIERMLGLPDETPDR